MQSFMEIGPHDFPKTGIQTHTQRRGNFIYIDDHLLMRT